MFTKELVLKNSIINELPLIQDRKLQMAYLCSLLNGPFINTETLNEIDDILQFEFSKPSI
mgnify:FL=1